MVQTLFVNNFKSVKDISEFEEIFIKSYIKESDKESIFEVDIQYSEKLHNLHNDSPEIIKLEKVEKLLANLRNKSQYAIRIRNLKRGKES